MIFDHDSNLRAAMPMLPSRLYVSDHTAFIRDLLRQKPQLVVEQATGRAIWWDKTPAELAEENRMDLGRVPQKPYVYSTD